MSNNVQQIIVHRNYFDQVVYNSLSEDPVGFFMFVAGFVAVVLALTCVYSFLDTHVTRIVSGLFPKIPRYRQAPYVVVFNLAVVLCLGLFVLKLSTSL